MERNFRQGHGRAPDAHEIPLRLLLLRPATLKALAEEVGLPYKLFQAAANGVVTDAARTWPAAIAASAVTPAQKAKMKAFLERHPAVQAVRRRETANRQGS